MHEIFNAYGELLKTPLENQTPPPYKYLNKYLHVFTNIVLNIFFTYYGKWYQNKGFIKKNWGAILKTYLFGIRLRKKLINKIYKI